MPFAERLNDLRLKAGLPSYGALQKADDNLRSSTISDVLCGRTRPTLDFVIRFVKACRNLAEQYGTRVDDSLFDEHGWQDDWIDLQQQLGRQRRQRLTAVGSAGNGVVEQSPSVGMPPAYPLPPDVDGFTGRLAELEMLDRLLDALAASAEAGTAVVVDGMPGVGKTALAVHWAHRVERQFDDGALFVDLNGVGPEAPMSTGQLIAMLASAPGQLRQVTTPSELLTRYRAGNRRRLAVLDNAASIDQIRPLLPPPAGTLILVTTSRRVSAAHLDGVHRIPLPPMTTAEATELLGRILRDAVPPVSDALDKIAERCGRLPLALRALADRPAASPWVVAFDRSYAALTEADQAAFRLLGVHPTGEFGSYAAADLLGRTVDEARARLDALTGAHLLDEIAPDRYRFHDLLGAYGRSLCDEHDGDDVREPAVRRLLAWYLRTADSAARRAAQCRAAGKPAPPSGAAAENEDAMRWCDVECANVIAAARLASTVGDDDTAWRLPHALLPYFERRRPVGTWIEVYRDAAASARKAGNVVGVAHSLDGLGRAYRSIRSFGQAMRCFHDCLAAFNVVGDLEGQIHVLGNLAATARDLGWGCVALTYCQQRLERSRQARNENLLSASLKDLADAELHERMHVEALAHVEQALESFRRLGDAAGEGRSFITLGEVYLGMDLHTKALDSLHRAIAILERIGDEDGVADAAERLRRLTP